MHGLCRAEALAAEALEALGVAPGPRPLDDGVARTPRRRWRSARRRLRAMLARLEAAAERPPSPPRSPAGDAFFAWLLARREGAHGLGCRGEG